MTLNQVVDYLFEIEGTDSEVDRNWLSRVIQYSDSGGNINMLTNRNDWQLIHIAALNGLDETAKWLVENGADVNSRDVQGCTPLLLAFDLDIDGAIQSGKEIDFSHSKNLINLGADTSIKNYEGRSLESTAAAYGRKMKALYAAHFEGE